MAQIAVGAKLHIELFPRVVCGRCRVKVTRWLPEFPSLCLHIRVSLFAAHSPHLEAILDTDQ